MDSALEFTDLSLGYGQRPVIEGLNLTLPSGKFTALIGPNGSGKSTLLKSLIRSVPIRAGSITVSGSPFSGFNAHHLARHISMLPQSTLAPDGVTVRQLVAYGRSPHSNIWGRLAQTDHEIVAAAIDRLGIVEFADRSVASLSGGQQQRAWLAMVLAQQAEIMLLDEPTTYLDISHQVDVLNLCRELTAEGTTVVAVLHDLNQAFRYADHIVILREGDVVACGAPDDVATSRTLRDAFDIDARIIKDPEAEAPMVIIRNKLCCALTAEVRKIS